MEAIQRASDERTVIVIAHKLATVKNSNMIYVMENAKLIASGTYANLAANCEAFRRLILIEHSKEVIDLTREIKSEIN